MPNVKKNKDASSNDKGIEVEEMEIDDESKSSEGSSVVKMQLGKEEIERMVNDGTLEKVSEGRYKVKSDTVKDLKGGKTLPNILPKTTKNQAMNALNLAAVSAMPTLSGNSTIVQQPGSYIALMPVNSQGNSSAILAAQNNPNFNPNIPTFLAVNQNVNAVNVNAGPSNQKAKVQTRGNISSVSPNGSGKRKPEFEDTKVKKPYKHARPLRKSKRVTKKKNYVSDFNSSEEEEDEDKTNYQYIGNQLASMFFKKIGETQKPTKSFVDKLHQSVFQENLSNTETESEEEPEPEKVNNDIEIDNASCELITCPGPGKIETYVGPGKNSKLTIVRSNETKMIRNFLYEVYKVRVASAGREANTNILIPVPEGFKFQYPLKANEEDVEFSHLPHDDSLNSETINPKYLEILAATKLKLRKYKDEIKVLRGRYLELLQEYANRPQFSTLSDLVGASAKFLTEDQLVFYLMQLKAGAHNMQGIRYSLREKVLALSIYQKSPEMYKWFRRLFNMPSKRSLDQWLEDIGNDDPQLLKKVLYHIYTAYNYKPVVGNDKPNNKVY